MVAQSNGESAVVATLKACAKQRDLQNGSRIHADALETGLLETSCYVASSVVSMYAKCGALKIARQVLSGLPTRDVVSWNALIAGYIQHRRGQEALNCIDEIHREGLSPDAVTFVCGLQACGSLGRVHEGKRIHEEIARKRLLEGNVNLGNALVDMYVKCGLLEKAQQLLHELPVRNVVTWNTLITGCTKQGKAEEALSCFDQMPCEGLSPDTVSFSCALRACGTIGASEKGEWIHKEILKQRLLDDDVVLSTALVDMYAKCGAFEKARQVLHELPVQAVVSWNALITGYVQQGKAEEALSRIDEMQREGLSPDAITYACALQACGGIGAAEKGEQIHEEILRRNLLKDNPMLSNALVNMYAKCGVLEKAQQVLHELSLHNVVSWTVLMAGYVQQGKGGKALNFIEQMQQKGISPDIVTFVCALGACGSIGAVDKGEQIHEWIVKQQLLETDVALGNALVDMYAKCGALEKARQVLYDLPIRDVVSWTALIAAYTQHGRSEEVITYFDRMQHEGHSPNRVTLVCVLSACSHSGFLDKGRIYFAEMVTKYGITPGIEHQSCMIDLFSRAGEFDKALAVIKGMSGEDFAGWHTLLGACCKWKNVEVGRLAFENALYIDKYDAAAYIIMSNIYVAAGMHENARKIEYMRVRNGACYEAGCSRWTDTSTNPLLGVQSLSGATAALEMGQESCFPSWKMFSGNI